MQKGLKGVHFAQFNSLETSFLRTRIFWSFSPVPYFCTGFAESAKLYSTKHRVDKYRWDVENLAWKRS